LLSFNFSANHVFFLSRKGHRCVVLPLPHRDSPRVYRQYDFTKAHQRVPSGNQKQGRQGTSNLRKWFSCMPEPNLRLPNPYRELLVMQAKSTPTLEV